MKTTERGGFVLLEAVVALAILGVASIVLLQVRSQQIRVATQARELLTAQALAEDRLAALRMLDYELLTDPPDSLVEGTFPAPFEAFSWTTEVALMEDEYDLFGVEVVVTGPAERFPLRTLVHRPGSMIVAAGGSSAGGVQGGMSGPGGMGGRMGGREGGPGGMRGEGGPGGRGGMQGGQGARGGDPGAQRPPGRGGGGGVPLPTGVRRGGGSP